MSKTPVLSAQERREKIRDEAARLGIDEIFIDALVEQFYAKIRQDEILGPIFNTAIGDNWAPHLAQMKRFWESVALGNGAYNGRPVPAHARHKTIEPLHFDHWLSMFEATLLSLSDRRETVDYFMERARRIANSLKLALFGVPGLGRPRYET